MATLATTSPSLLDLALRLDPDGSIATIAEILNQKNDILDDIPFVEANGVTSHQTTVRSGIPVPTWRKLYGGVQPVKSETTKIVDTMGMLENYAEVDQALADLNGNTAAFRLSEDRPIMQGMSDEFATNLFYGNEQANAERFTGLSPRFNLLTGAESGKNIISAAGSSNCASIWLGCWADHIAHGIYPKGSQAGLQMKDKGLVTIEDVDGSNGGRMEAYRSHYRWNVGFCLRDWRYWVRIANIDVTALTKDAATGPDLVDLMTQALELIQDLTSGPTSFYMNRRLRGFLRRQMVAKIKSSTLTWEMEGGKPVMRFDEIPVRRCDSLLNTETAVA